MSNSTEFTKSVPYGQDLRRRDLSQRVREQDMGKVVFTAEGDCHSARRGLWSGR
jgi:hypothetical protein